MTRPLFGLRCKEEAALNTSLFSGLRSSASMVISEAAGWYLWAVLSIALTGGLTLVILKHVRRIIAEKLGMSTSVL